MQEQLWPGHLTVAIRLAEDYYRYRLNEIVGDTLYPVVEDTSSPNRYLVVFYSDKSPNRMVMVTRDKYQEKYTITYLEARETVHIDIEEIPE